MRERLIYGLLTWVAFCGLVAIVQALIASGKVSFLVLLGLDLAFTAGFVGVFTLFMRVVDGKWFWR